MKISIVTVTYNCRNFIRRTIRSVVSQSIRNIEYWIIDGNSTDGTYSIALKYADKNKYIKCISEPDTGIYNAMNKALEHVSGDYVLFLNAGDFFYSTDTLKYFVEYIERLNNPDIIYGNAIFYKGKEVIKIDRRRINKKMFILAGTVCHQSVLAKVELFKEYNFDESFQYCADRDWLYYMYFKGKRFEYMPEVIVFFEGSGFSADKTAEKSIVEERLRLQKKYCKKYYYIHMFLRKTVEKMNK